MNKITNITRIGNSKGIRIPKEALIRSELPDKVELEVKRGEIRIVPAKTADSFSSAVLSEKSLAKDWLNPAEDKAWSKL